MKSDIEIAQEAKLLPISEVAQSLGLTGDDIETYGKYKCKITEDYLRKIQGNKRGKLVLVTAINPTPAGEGKTTTSIGLAMGLNRLGHKAVLALREPSLGPCFGLKGGAAGGGYSQVVPMDELNLHFIVVGLGAKADGYVREDHFVITVASEVMAILCLSDDLEDLRKRLGRMVVAYKRDGSIVTAKDIGAVGAMMALLKDAIKPNLIQTLEHTPALVHGGPFANIAHGCNSVRATKTALKLSDITITEAGFGADLGAEKFLDIKCPMAGLNPDACVIVATVRALKYNGGVAQEDLAVENIEALGRGIVNLEKHIENIGKYGIPVVVTLNAFDTDTEEELEYVRNFCLNKGCDFALSKVWAKGGEGGEELARAVINTLENKKSNYRPLYDPTLPIHEKIEIIAREIYGAKDVSYSDAASKKMAQLSKQGFGNLPICMAKTQYSLSDDPTLLGRPVDFTLNVRDMYVSAGAGFIVALTGNIMTMPGLPKRPAAFDIDVDENGKITGLF